MCRSCLNDNDRRRGIVTASDGFCLFRRNAQVNVLPVAWLEAIADHRLGQISGGAVIKLIRRLHRLLSEVDRERVAVGSPNFLARELEPLFFRIDHDGADLLFGDIVVALLNQLNDIAPIHKSTLVKNQRVILRPVAQYISKKSRNPLGCQARYPS